MRRTPLLTVIAVTALLVGCGAVTGSTDEDPLRRSVIELELHGRGPFTMDLRARPPTIDGDGAATVEVVDLAAAGMLRDRLLDLPVRTDDCATPDTPVLQASVATYPRAQDAEFADLAYTQVGGPCSDLGPDEVAELVGLWNRAGGDLDVAPSG